MTGCRNNRYELDKIQEWALQNNVIVASEDEADFSVINTCTVTHVADRKSRQLVRKIKNHNPNLKTIVFGCAARMQKSEFKTINEIDFLLPDLQSVIDFLEDMRNSSLYNTNVYSHRTLPLNRSRALVQIQDGCDNYCSYCIIAAARGKSKNRPEKKIIEEVENHIKNGFNEAVLTGINIGAYGCSNTTKPGESKLAELLQNILNKTDIKRIRLSSMGPEYFLDDNKLLTILKNPRICRHIHLSIQSGSDEVLKRMKRNYSVKQMDNVIRKLTKEIPGIAITTDIIVGFPGETDVEFMETVNFVKQYKNFAKAHIFPYSIRKNTPAAILPQVSDVIKKERTHKLTEITNKLKLDFINSQNNTSASILWETENEGLSDNYIRIHSTEKHIVRSVTTEKIKDNELILD